LPHDSGQSRLSDLLSLANGTEDIALLKEGWFEDFFSGAALDLWRNAIPQETTEREVEFLSDVFSLPEGSRLLDAPCGNGRLSLPFALLKYKVTGIDFSAAFVAEAKETARTKKVQIDYLQGDMRNLSFENEFDGAFCMGNSFGYFDRAGTLQFFQSVSRSLKSGAKFVIDSAMVAETFLVNGGVKEWVQVGDIYMLIENKYDCRQSLVETDYTFVSKGKEEKRRALHWIYSAGEVCHMLEQADFVVDDLFSSTDCDEFSLGDERLLLVAHKS